MLFRVFLLASAICMLAVFTAGRIPDWLAASVHASGTAGEPSQRPVKPEASPTGERQATLRKGRGGHVVFDASINGSAVTMIVDTGASTVALSGETARRLGYSFARSDYKIPIRTANGSLMAAPLRLREVRVGDISLLNVEAVVLPVGALDGNLLGMSFLNRLRKFEFTSNELVLTQ